MLQQIGLDVKKFDEELDSGKYKAKVQAAQDLAQQLGIRRHAVPAVERQPVPAGINYLAYPDLEGVVK